MANNINYKSIVADVAGILGIEKLRWSAAVRLCKSAMEDGFTHEDFVQAAQGMKGADRQYWSIYSIFTKPDYWMAKATQEEEKKGVW